MSNAAQLKITLLTQQLIWCNSCMYFLVDCGLLHFNAGLLCQGPTPANLHRGKLRPMCTPQLKNWNGPSSFPPVPGSGTSIITCTLQSGFHPVSFCLQNVLNFWRENFYLSQWVRWMVDSLTVSIERFHGSCLHWIYQTSNEQVLLVIHFSN